MNTWMRQTHRWVSVAFSVAVLLNIVVMTMNQGQQPPAWVTYSPLLPLLFLLLTGLYLFVLPYVSKRRSAPRAAE